MNVFRVYIYQHDQDYLLVFPFHTPKVDSYIVYYNTF